MKDLEAGVLTAADEEGELGAAERHGAHRRRVRPADGHTGDAER